MSTLSIHQLSCVRQDRRLFHDISLQLQAGEMLLVEGENGTGKSSLLRLLAGLASARTGQITWHGQSIQQTRSHYADAMHYIGHANGIKLGLSVLENIQLTSHLSGKPPINITDVLSTWRLIDCQHQAAHHLSAGQKRRLALAKLFLFPKTIWILDEPLTALDAESQVLFLTHLENHLKQGGISIISSHHAIHVQGHIKTLRLSPC